MNDQDGSPPASGGESRSESRDGERCAICHNATLEWQRCKLVCTTCGTIQQSCADL